MNYLKSISHGVSQDWMHDFFTRFSRGEFTGPVACATAKGKITVKASYEYAGLLGHVIASNSNGLYLVDGGIFSKTDFRPDIKNLTLDGVDKSKKKYFQMNFKAAELDAETLEKLYSAIPYADTLLTLKPLEKQPYSIACGKKPPKPGGEKKDEFLKAGFDKSAMQQLLDEVFFGSGKTSFNEANVENTYEIMDFEVPADAKTPEDKRIMAKRAGKLRRKVTVDEETFEGVFEFKI